MHPFLCRRTWVVFADILQISRCPNQATFMTSSCNQFAHEETTAMSAIYVNVRLGVTPGASSSRIFKLRDLDPRVSNQGMKFRSVSPVNQ